MSQPRSPYDIDTSEIMFATEEVFDVYAIGQQFQPWWNRTLCAVNDTWVRLGVMEGDFHWHKHEDTDEFFLVMEGHLDIELEGRMVSLKLGQAFTVPKGVMHFPHARGRSVVLMIERSGFAPLADGASGGC